MNTTTSSTPVGEMLSALADGELRSDEIPAALLACKDGGDAAMLDWRSYHVIGDVLRRPAVLVSAVGDVRFLERLNLRLAREPALAGTVTAVPRSAALHAAAQTGRPVVVPDIPHGSASNDDVFRWKLVAGFASLTAAVAIAWNASGFLLPAAAPQLAQAPATEQVLVVSPNGPVVRDARLQELLAAHRQLGGATALQAPSGFLRNATFETPMGSRR